MSRKSRKLFREIASTLEPEGIIRSELGSLLEELVNRYRINSIGRISESELGSLVAERISMGFNMFTNLNEVVRRISLYLVNVGILGYSKISRKENLLYVGGPRLIPAFAY